MLIATDYARKMSLDLRMISEEQYSDHIDNKASHCAKMLADYYQKFDVQKGTQFVFSDLGTYKPGEWNVYSEIKRKLIEDYKIPAHEIRFIQECKNERAKKAMVEAMNRGEIRIIFGSTSMLGTALTPSSEPWPFITWIPPGDHRTSSNATEEPYARAIK